MPGHVDSARKVALAMLCAVFLLLPGASMACAQAGQGDDAMDRPISQIHIVGNQRVTEQMILNNIRAAIGDPYDPATVSRDVRRLSRLGEFKHIVSEVQLLQDGSLALTYRFTEQTIIIDVQVTGNRLIKDEDLAPRIPILPGGPRDDSLINNGKRAIEDLYRQRGYYLTTVMLDTTALEERSVVIYQVREGPRVRVKAVEYRGNDSLPAKRLNAEIKTKPEKFILRKGELSEEVITGDIASLVRFYKSRGYLDVRVDRQIELSPNNREAKVVFLVQEGRQYRLGRVQAQRRSDGGPLRVFSSEQLAAMLEMKTGDVFRGDLLSKSVQAVREAYSIMGYLDVLESQNVQAREFRSSDEPVVDLLLEIEEGRSSKVGTVQINGNFLTRDKVIRRHVRLEPGRPFNALEIEKARRNLLRTRLFNDVRFTLQEPDEVDPEYRDLLVEIKERNTGSLNFGFAVGSDSGLFGEFSYAQNNFDVTDVPESFDELIRGRAFRGGGQRFSMTLRPGNEFFQYLVSLTEPNLFDSDYSLNTTGAYRTRIYDNYDEERLSGSVQLGRKFGDIWNGSVQFMAQNIELTEFDPSTPVEIRQDAGPDTLVSTGFNLSRTTIETFTRPGKGSRFELGFDYFGIGGDVDFQRITSEYTVLLTLSEDFLGRKSILKLSTRAGHIFNGDAPTYEKFYMGGRTMRGFDFRTVSPKGINPLTGMVGDDPIGGDWMFFLGAQYEVPIMEESMTGVVFIDSGTVTNDVGFDEYRVSVGMGLRLYIPAFGQLPIAFDFATPITMEDGDETQVFSFTAELPF